MKIVGIIIESNPYHNGHQYLIDKVKNELKPDILVALSSGYFTMRGEISTLNKTNKTKILLNAGFDLVIDFPCYHLLNSADYFGENAINILNSAGITHLAFGIEHNNINSLKQVISLTQNLDFNKSFQKKLNNNLSYKKAFQETLKEFSQFDDNFIDLTMKSNNTLALSYLKALNKYPNIIPYAIQRFGNSEENRSLTSFPSGTALREKYIAGNDISMYLPYDSRMLSDLKNYSSNLKPILDYVMLQSPEFFSNCLHISDGIDSYVIKNYDKMLTFEENVDKLSNKIFSKSRIRRTLLSMILQIPKEINYQSEQIRIIGFSKKGSAYLKEIKSNIIMNISKQSNDIIKLELKVSQLYDILTKQDNYNEEFKFPLKGV